MELAETGKQERKGAWGRQCQKPSQGSGHAMPEKVLSHLGPPSLAWASLYFKALTALALTAQKETQMAWREWPGFQVRKGLLVPALLDTLPTVALSPSCPLPHPAPAPTPAQAGLPLTWDGKQGVLPQPSHNIILPMLWWPSGRAVT